MQMTEVPNQQNVLRDLTYRMLQVEALKVEVDKLKGLNIAQGIAALSGGVSAAPVDDADTRINDLEGQLRTAVEDSRVQKETWDGETVALEARLAASVSGSIVIGASSVRGELLRQIQIRLMASC
jgi:hypothetical protein